MSNKCDFCGEKPIYCSCMDNPEMRNIKPIPMPEERIEMNHRDWDGPGMYHLWICDEWQSTTKCTCEEELYSFYGYKYQKVPESEYPKPLEPCLLPCPNPECPDPHAVRIIGCGNGKTFVACRCCSMEGPLEECGGARLWNLLPRKEGAGGGV
jgi:hypothetical protein